MSANVYCDQEQEEALLGGVMANPEHFAIVAASVHGEDFSVPAHAFVWKAFVELETAGRPIDLALLEAQLKCSSRYQFVMQTVALSALPHRHAGLEHIEAYARNVAELARVRRVVTEANRVVDLAVAGKDPTRFADDSVEAIVKAGTSRSSLQIQSPAERMLALDRFREECMARKGEVSGIKTGLVDLDWNTGGLRAGEMTVLAARSGMGKSALMLCVALAAARKGKHVLIFSMEMPALELDNRMVCSIAGVNSQRMRQGELTRRENERYIEAEQELGSLPITILDDRGITLQQMRARALQVHARQPIGLLMIDHLGLFDVGISNARAAEQKHILLGQATKACRKLIATRGGLGVPLLLLHQLNRDCEGRSNKRPMLSDLKASGDIEEDADNVWLLYRDDYYDRNSKNKGITEIILGKQREGPQNETVKVLFDAEYTRFGNLECVGSNGYSESHDE